jgi:hypothetical protein
MYPIELKVSGIRYGAAVADSGRQDQGLSGSRLQPHAGALHVQASTADYDQLVEVDRARLMDSTAAAEK